MPRQKGFAALILLIIILLLIFAVGFLVYTKKIPGLFNSATSTQSSAQSSSSLLKTEYQNPFEEKSSYTNPFSETDYQNPFDNLQQ